MADLRAALGAQRLAGELLRCRHPRPDRTRLANGDTQCLRCQRVIPAALSRRGRNARSRGNRRELTLAREVGGVKVGHHGGPDDVRASMFVFQSKVRAAFPTWMTTELDKLPRSEGRIPVLVITGPAGLDPTDRRRRPAIAVVHLADWRDLHGETR